MKKVTVRLWLTRLVRYLAIPTALCAILLPLHGIFRQQTIRAQLTGASEQLAASVSDLENDISDIRYVTNKLFHDSAYALLAASSDGSLLVDSTTTGDASSLLDSLTYSLSSASYSYVTFRRNGYVVDSSRFYLSTENFYPSAVEYENLGAEQWQQAVASAQAGCIPSQQVRLYQTGYPDNYLTYSQPFYDANNRFAGTCSVLLRESQLLQLFLPYEEWMEGGLLYIATDDGTVLLAHNYSESAPLEDLRTDGPQTYEGEEYLFVSRRISDLNATVVIGLPYRVYAAELKAVDRVILAYILAGLLGCVLLSVVMTYWDLRRLRPLLTAIDTDAQGNPSLEEAVLQKLYTHDRLTRELQQAQSQLDYGRVEGLLKLGFSGTEAERSQLRELLHLGAKNYLLYIPASADTELREDVRLILITEQAAICFSGSPYVHSAADGSAIVVLAEEDTPQAEERLRQRCELLRSQLKIAQGLVLSPGFTRLEQISSAYWKVRNARPDCGEGLLCLPSSPPEVSALPQVTALELLNEYLLAGRTEQAQELVRSLFAGRELSLGAFRQIFYSVRGVLLAAAEKIHCEDISAQYSYDAGQSVRRQIQGLCDGCLIVCAHVDSLKQSHNEQLQESILRYLAENYSDPELNAAMVAQRFRISKKYVSQFLKDQGGKSFNEYLEELRLTKAAELLRDSDLGITDIANACGFASQNTFYKAFRRRYGESPSVFRAGGAEKGEPTP